MIQTRKLDDELAVCSFISPAELPALAKQFSTVINNRPDGEEPGQATSAELDATARRLGLDYVHIPIVPGQFGDDQVVRFAEVLAQRPGRKLAFCRTGTRSASLWALAKSATRTADDLMRAAREAGYDLSSLEPRLRGVGRQ